MVAAPSASRATNGMLLTVIIIILCVVMPLDGVGASVPCGTGSLTTRPSGTYNITIDNFHLAPVGASQDFKSGNGCDQLWLKITVGAKFWQLEVENAYSCHCSPCESCQPPEQPWEKRKMGAFLARFFDVSTSTGYQLPTRHNSPVGVGTALLTIPNGVDRNQVTSSTLISLEFRNTDYKSYRTDDDADNLACNAASGDGGTHVQEYVESATMGIKVHRWGRDGGHDNPAPRNQVYITRKRPYPPVEMVLNYLCCPRSFSYSCRWKVLSKQETGVPMLTEWMPTDVVGGCCGPSYSTCRCREYYFSLGFSEFTRYYKATYSHNNISTVGENGVTAANGLGNVSVWTPLDAIHDIQFRFVNLGLSVNSTKAMESEADPKHWRRRALYLLQPFPMSDVWIRVYDEETGTLIFEDAETHIPYYAKDNEEQVGWLWPLDGNERLNNGRFVSWTHRVEIKYNRRPRIGHTTEESQKAGLLYRWLRDKGASVANIVSPIPPTVLIKPRLMGATAAADIAGSAEVGTVPDEAIYHSKFGERFYNLTLKAFIELHETCAETIQNANRSSDPLDLRHLKNALFAVLKATSPYDHSSWFVFYDSWHPARNPDFPVFYDETVLGNVLGFSEIPRMIAERRQRWRSEYENFSSCFPWWKREISEFRWENTRAWSIASSYWKPTPDPDKPELDHLIQLPGPNIWRAGGDPNVEVDFGGWREHFPNQLLEAKLVAKVNRSIAQEEELVLDYNSGVHTQTGYFMDHGDAPVGCVPSVTLPGHDDILNKTDDSRKDVAARWEVHYNITYKAALRDLIDVMTVKLSTLPLAVDGLGAEATHVQAAERVLAGERDTLQWQIPRGWTEHNAL